jgi:hypothetical protein
MTDTLPARRNPRLRTHVTSPSFNEKEAELLGDFATAQIRINWRAEQLRSSVRAGSLSLRPVAA